MKTDDEMYQSLLSRWEDYKENGDKRKNKIMIIIVPAAVALGGCFAFWVAGNVNSIIQKVDHTPSIESTITIVPTVTPEKKEEETSEPEKRELRKAVDPENATKDDIFYLMLNSIDYYDKVSGRFINKSSRCEYYEEITFQTCLSETRSYSLFRKYRDNVTEDQIMAGTAEAEQEIARYCDGKTFTEIYPMTRNWKNISNEIIPLSKVVQVPDHKRIFVRDGAIGYSYETNPTNVTLSSQCIFPQEYTFGFLLDQGLWEISDIAEYDARKCYFIKGTTSPSYRLKNQVVNFEFTVDVNTGVLLRYDGYDENGTLRDFMHTENIRFEEESEQIEVLPEGITEEYTEIRNNFIPEVSAVEDTTDYEAVLEPYRKAFDEFNKTHDTLYGFMTDEQLKLHNKDKQQYLKEIAEYYSTMTIDEFYDYLENAYDHDVGKLNGESD